MARGKSSAFSRPDVATKGRFDLLNIDVDQADSDDELPPPASTLSPPPTTPSKKALARQRAKLRKKNSQLDLGANGENGEGGNDSDASSLNPASSAIPPVPSLLNKDDVVEAVNGAGEGVMEKAAEVAEGAFKATAPAPVKEQAPLAKENHQTEEIKQRASAPEPSHRDLPPKEAPSAPHLPTSAPYVPAVTNAERPPAPASVSTSDGESQRGFSDDEDEDDEEEEAQAAKKDDNSAPSTATPASPNAATPRPASPAPASSALTTDNKPKEAYTGADHDPNKKIKAIIQRTVWGVVMAGGAIGLVAMGHVYVVALVFLVQAVVFKELTGLFDAGYSGAHATEEGKITRTPEREAKRKGRKEERERWSRRMAWYFFSVTNYYLYGESLIYYFKHVLTIQASFLPTAYSFAQHHRLISFGLYTIGFVSFVATLSRSSLRRQFGLFGWIHMSLLLIVVSSHFIVNNILEGMIWFWVPASLVIINDVAAYVCGMLFGRHQLIKLSPKKTVEGFVGAFFVTIVFAVIWSTIFMRFKFMICPAQDLTTSAFSQVTCRPNPVFVFRDFPLPASVTTALEPFLRHRLTSIPWAPFQLHSIVLAAFASLVAPFGGFFASGFKRAFGIKDFGDSIPGHGGMTDRMDCQFLMGLFSYVYYASLIRETHITPQTVLATVVTHLTTEQQLEVLGELTKLLAAKGVEMVKPW
ncbi:hypothetical protein JCM6882_002431 [Rhodosporidiobolus microsporus]